MKELKQIIKQEVKMNATKLTIIAIALAAVVVGGCSTDNRVLSPGSDLQSETAINTANRVGSGSGSEFDSNESATELQHLTILAKVQSLDVEGGCFYLQADDGNTYTPVSGKGLVLESGLKLKAEGYIDKNIQFFCGNGPAFVIENYDIISKSGSRDSKNVSEKGLTKEVKALEKGNNDFITFKGSVDITKEGCLVLTTADKSEYVLSYDADVVLNKGDEISATGYISTLPYFTCYEAPLFYAQSISVLSRSKEVEKSDRPENEMAPGMTDDNDRYVAPVDDRRPDDSVMEMDKGLNDKEKAEAEGNLIELPRDERAPSVPVDESDNGDFQRPVDDSNSQFEVMKNEERETKKGKDDGTGSLPENERP